VRVCTQQFATVELKQTFDPSRPIRRYRDGYKTELKKHTLSMFLKVLYFADKCKECQLLPGDPCLFVKVRLTMCHGCWLESLMPCVWMQTAPFKSTRDIIVDFAKNYLSGEGDVVRHLALLGCDLVTIQTPLQEYDYTVNQLSVDIRDGVRLTKLAEIILASQKALPQVWLLIEWKLWGSGRVLLFMSLRSCAVVAWITAGGAATAG